MGNTFTHVECDRLKSAAVKEWKRETRPRSQRARRKIIGSGKETQKTTVPNTRPPPVRRTFADTCLIHHRRPQNDLKFGTFHSPICLIVTKGYDVIMRLSWLLDSGSSMPCPILLGDIVPHTTVIRGSDVSLQHDGEVVKSEAFVACILQGRENRVALVMQHSTRGDRT